MKLKNSLAAVALTIMPFFARAQVEIAQKIHQVIQQGGGTVIVKIPNELTRQHNGTGKDYLISDSGGDQIIAAINRNGDAATRRTPDFYYNCDCNPLLLTVFNEEEEFEVKFENVTDLVKGDGKDEFKISVTAQDESR